MKSIWICSGLVFLSGCLTNEGLTTVAQSDKNISNLTRISLGMDEGDVMQRMHRPYAEETYTIGEDQYDVWFYVTNPTVLGQSKMVHYNLTPLTFKNDILTAIGWDYYKWVKEQSKLPPQPIVPASPVPPTEVIGTQPPDSADGTSVPSATTPNEDANLEQVLTPADSTDNSGATNSDTPESNIPDSNTPAEDADIEKVLDDAHEESTSTPSTIPTPVQAPVPSQSSPCIKPCPGLLEAMNTQKTNEKKKADEKKKKEDQEKKDVDMDQEDEDFQDQERQQETNFW